MRQIQDKKFYHLGNIERTLEKLQAQTQEHLQFLNNNDDSRFKTLWEGSLLKN